MIEWLTLSLLTVGQVIPCSSIAYRDIERPAELEQAIGVHICEPLENEYESVNLMVIAVRGQVKDSGDTPEKNLSRWSSSPLKAGRIKLQQSAVKSRGAIVWFKVEAKKAIWVAKNNLPPGTKITGGMVTHKPVDVAPYIGVKLLFESSPVGMYLAGSHSKGLPFVDGELRTPPLAVRSEVVKVSYSERNFAIELSGVLLENAWSLGDVVQVRLLRGNKIINGVVTGKRNVSAVL